MFVFTQVNWDSHGFLRGGLITGFVEIKIQDFALCVFVCVCFHLDVAVVPVICGFFVRHCTSRCPVYKSCWNNL